MASPLSSGSVSGALSIATGAVVAGVGAGVVPADPVAVQVPGWALGVCGALSALGGLALVAQRWPAVRRAAVAALFVAFGAVAGAVAVFAEARHLAGGIGLFPPWLTLALARGVFGFGAALCLGLAGWAAAGRLAPADGPPDASG